MAMNSFTLMVTEVDFFLRAREWVILKQFKVMTAFKHFKQFDGLNVRMIIYE